MALQDNRFPTPIGEIFYFPIDPDEDDGDNFLFSDEQSALRFAKDHGESYGVKGVPKKADILSYNMQEPVLDEYDCDRDQIPSDFSCVGSLAYLTRPDSGEPDRFFASALDVARFSTWRKKDFKVTISTKFQILPVLKLDSL